jgi:hypothetical protein
MLAALIVLPLAPLARGLAAQEVGLRVAAVRAWSPHRLLADPVGGVVTVSRRWGDKLALRFGYEWIESERGRIGTPCVGLVEPGTCPPEPMRMRGRSQVFTFGAAARLVRWSRARLDFAQNVRLGDLSAHEQGLESGRIRSAGEGVLGLDLGLEASVAPRAAWPLALHAAARYGNLVPQSPAQVIDGYSPFTDGFGLTRIELGMELRWGWRAGR